MKKWIGFACFHWPDEVGCPRKFHAEVREVCNDPSKEAQILALPTVLTCISDVIIDLEKKEYLKNRWESPRESKPSPFEIAFFARMVEYEESLTYDI